MAALLSADDIRTRVATDLDDDPIEQIIAEEDAEIVRRFGSVAESLPIVERVDSEKQCNVYTPRRISTVALIAEGDGVTQTNLVVGDYRIWEKEGRIERLSALGTLAAWRPIVDVTYTPESDTIERKRVLLELCRISLERRAMLKESVGQSDYTFETPKDWEKERERLLSKLDHFLLVA